MAAQRLLDLLDIAAHEVALFAAFGFLLLGAADLLVDMLWLGGRTARAALRRAVPTLADLPPPERPGPLAVFVPAWDEGEVIATMLRSTLARFDHDDYRIFVGCYPNDPATIAAVRAVADPRVALVIGDTPGPTTKADCLNRLWEAMEDDEQSQRRRFKAVVLHDAEDVVHSAALRLFDTLVERHDLVQIPVLPLIDPRSRWVGGHYADEFAESHAKELVVRAALGAAIPSAGVGCAFARDALARVAEAQGGPPFDADSLTEDYELGLRLKALGCTQAFVRIAAAPGKPPVATREYFPGTVDAAVAQKARWVTGIALSGWDRLGWRGGLAERWMRLRDRQTLLAATVLFAGYASLLVWTMLRLPALAGWQPREPSPALAAILQITFAMLLWRLALRAAFVTRAYGWRQGLLSAPRMIVGNYIAMRAAWRALGRYRATRAGGGVAWDKTTHMFPAEVPAE